MAWRQWIKPSFIILYSLLLCIAIPIFIIEIHKKSAPDIFSAWFIGGLFALGAVPISLWTIIEHLIHYTKPYLQRHIIRILWMVPIYALDAWFALKFPASSIYFDTLRECYEAYVIYNFLAFLLNYLRHEYPDLGYVLEQKQPVPHLPPLCCMEPWPMGRHFVDRCRHGTLQYTVIRPITTIIALICALCGVYGEGSFSPKEAFVYLTVINNISQVWALYCLILFYRCAKEELRPMKPVSKFLCVKFVVFMSFWQSILIVILAASGVIQQVESWKLYDVRSISIGLQNFAICIEMFLAALAHHFSFSATPYINPDAASANCCTSWWSMWDVSDMRRDVVEHVKHVGTSVRHIGQSSSRIAGSSGLASRRLIDPRLVGSTSCEVDGLLVDEKDPLLSQPSSSLNGRPKVASSRYAFSAFIGSSSSQHNDLSDSDSSSAFTALSEQELYREPNDEPNELDTEVTTPTPSSPTVVRNIPTGRLIQHAISDTVV